MHFLIIMLLTSAFSYAFSMANHLRIFKDVADEGCKINLDKINSMANNIRNESNPDLSNNSKLLSKIILFIPFVNMAKVTLDIMKYNTVRPYIVNELRNLDAIEYMTDEERALYEKNPTGLQSFAISSKTQKARRKEKAETCYLKYNVEGSDAEGEIVYRFNDRSKSDDLISIISATGDAANLSEEEQKQAVHKVILSKVSEFAVDKYGSMEEFKKAYANNHEKVATELILYCMAKDKEDSNEQTESKSNGRSLVKKRK